MNLLNSILCINDLLQDNGQFLHVNSLNNRFGTNISIMQYNSIMSSIPKEWKSLLKTGTRLKHINDDIVVKINKIPKKHY